MQVQLGTEVPCWAAHVAQPTYNPPDRTGPTKREDKRLLLGLCQGTSHLHGGCLVIVLMVHTALASLSTIMATAPDCGRGV